MPDLLDTPDAPDTSAAAEPAVKEPGKTSFADAFMNAVEGKEPAKEEPKAAEQKPAEPAKAAEPEPKKETSALAKILAQKGKPPESAKTEPASEIDKITEPEFKDPKQQGAWAALRKRGKEFEAKARELEAKISEKESAGGNTKALEEKLAALEQERDDLAKVAKFARAEMRPEYRKINSEKQGAIGRVQTILKESGVSDSDIERVIVLRGDARMKALSEVDDGLPRWQSGRLGRAIDEIEALEAREQTIVADPQKQLKEWEEQEALESRKRQESSLVMAQNAFESAQRKLSTELELLHRVDGEDDWNKQADAILSNARSFYESNDSYDRAAEVAIKAEAAPIYRKLLLEEQGRSETLSAKVTELEKELKGLYGKSPSVDSRGAANGDGKPVSFADRVAAEAGWKE